VRLANSSGKNENTRHQSGPPTEGNRNRRCSPGGGSRASSRQLSYGRGRQATSRQIERHAQESSGRPPTVAVRQRAAKARERLASSEIGRRVISEIGRGRGATPKRNVFSEEIGRLDLENGASESRQLRCSSGGVRRSARESASRSETSLRLKAASSGPQRSGAISRPAPHRS